jgi:hypothetical protein
MHQFINHPAGPALLCSINQYVNMSIFKFYADVKKDEYSKCEIV